MGVSQSLTYHERVGSGASGTVYRVTWKSKEFGTIEAAAKKIRYDHGKITAGQKREIEILKKLDHKNIIRYYDTVLEKDHVVIVTEFAAKGSLYDYLKETEKLPELLLHKWIYHLARGIHYLERNNVAHCDLKSPNCILTADDVLKLCDFGISRELIGEECTEDAIKGSWKWQAPEIFKDVLLSHKATVYAFGIIVWEMVSCEELYKGKRSEYVVYNVMTEGLRPTFPDDCPPFLRTLMEQCWQQDHTQRPNSRHVVMHTWNEWSSELLGNCIDDAKIPRENIELVKRIAHGAYGTVYRAQWENQVVAAKRVDREEGEKELKFLSELDHPNIVKLYGFVDNKVDVDIILEFCDGGSLRDYLDKHRGTHLGQRFYDWAKLAGRPIAYLKKMGVVHKDIKSSNYLITNEDGLKLCDFGLAKEIDATMTSATERASYQWMAPELLKEGVLSPKYDIFAYGVVVWELWTTDIPWEGCESTNMIYRICINNERLPIPTDCAKPIADLIRQCWETDWKERPSMEEALSMVDSI